MSIKLLWLISKKTIIFQGSRGGPTFSRGVQLFPGGSNCLFPIETHITCDFPGGSGPPVHPSGSALVFGAAYAAPNKVTTILYLFSSTNFSIFSVAISEVEF